MISKIKFISLSSGSSGNCYFIGNDKMSLIIDAGISVRAIKRGLAEYDIELDSIDMILLTHDHHDHIKHIATLASKYSKPIYATAPLHKVLERKGSKIANTRVLEKEIPVTVKGVEITAFEVSHDATDAVGFHIDMFGERFTIITDLGVVTKRVKEYCKISNHIVIESNYDVEMLANGGYEPFLIDRIRGGRGHLSNEQAAEAIEGFYHDRIKNIFLCHLSDNNNTPKIAYETAANMLSKMGVNIGEGMNLHCLPRKDSKCYLI